MEPSATRDEMSRRHIETTHCDPAAAVFENAIPLSVLPSLVAPASEAPGPEAPALNIWIGYTKNGRHYLDKQLKEPNTEQQIRELQEYTATQFSKFEFFILRWVYCQMAIVQIGELPMSASYGSEDKLGPREVYFDSLEEHGALSVALKRPETLRECWYMFHETDAFNVKAISMASTRRSVLCMGYTIDRNLLIWPLLLTVSVATVVAVVVGLSTRSIACGAEIGSFVGVILSLVWTYVLWISR